MKKRNATDLTSRSNNARKKEIAALKKRVELLEELLTDIDAEMFSFEQSLYNLKYLPWYAPLSKKAKKDLVNKKT